MIIDIKKVIFSVFLILLILNNYVKSDITESEEINTLWWLGIQYGLQWDLSTNICNNNGIICNNEKTHVIKLILDDSIPKGLVIVPGGTSSSSGSGSGSDSISTTTTSDITSTNSGSGTTYTSNSDYSSTSSGGGSGTSTSYSTTSDYSSTSGSGTTYTSNSDYSSTSSGTSYSTTSDYSSTSGSGSSSGSGTSTSYSSGISSSLQTSGFTTITPTIYTSETPISALIVNENKGRSLLSTPRGSPNEITYLYLPQLQTLAISISSVSSINILLYIGNSNITYLEISNDQQITWPTESNYLYNLPKLSSIKLSNLAVSTIPDEFLEKGFPLSTLVIDFPVSYFPWVLPLSAIGIKSLTLNYNGANNIIIDGYTWQLLEDLNLKTTTNVNVINFSSLNNVEFYCSNNVNSNSFTFDSNSEMLSNVFRNCKLQVNYNNSNLTNLSILDSTISGTISTFSLPPSLELLDIERSTTYFLPSDYQLPNLKQLILPYNTINTGFSPFNQLIKVNATNSNIPGSIPDTFCTIPSIELSKNKFLSVPDCFLCHWQVTSIWFTGNTYSLLPDGYQCTTATVSKTSFEVLSVGESLEFSGNDLGWGSTGSDSGLHVIIPNKKFKYNFPPQSQGITQKLISFSSQVSFTFTWTYYDLTISNVVFTQNPNYLVIDIIGSFDSSSKIYLNNIEYTPDSRNNTNIQLLLSTAFSEGKVSVKIQSTLISTTFDTVYRRLFPVITSASIAPKLGGQVTIYGNFYYLDKTQSSSNEIPLPVRPIVNNRRSLLQITEDTQDIKVYVNGQECLVVFSNSTVIIFSAPASDKGGYSNIVVENLNYNFTSTKVLYYDVSTNECSKVCENGGSCVAGSCKCVGEYYGPTCTFKMAPSNSYTLVADETKPSATYSFEKVDFEFSLQSVQEISPLGQVVKQINTTDWDSQPIQVEGLGSGTQYESTQTTGDISIKVTVVIINESLTYEFAGISMNLEPNQVKVSMNISKWDFESSLNTLRAIFISTSKSTTINECESNDQQVGTQTDGNGLLSFSIKRSGAVLLGQFINRLLSNGNAAHSEVEDLGVDSNGISYAGINIPHCDICILDPDFSSLLDPGFKSDNKCGDNKRAWVVPVAVVIPIIAVCALSVVGYLFLKKRFYIARDGKSIKLTRRGSKRNSYGLDSFKK